MANTIKLGIFGFVLSAILIFGASKTVSGSEAAKAADAKKSTSENQAVEKMTIPEVGDFKNQKEYGIELDKKREELQQRLVELDEYEKRIKEREKALDEKIKQLSEIRDAITGVENKKKLENEERVNKLVSVFETMSPKSSAGVFETLDDELAVDVLKKMDIKKMAKLMNTMDKGRSAKLSELMTGRKNSMNSENLSKRSEGQGGNAKDRMPASQPAPVAAPKAEAPSAVKPGESANPKKGG